MGDFSISINDYFPYYTQGIPNSRSSLNNKAECYTYNGIPIDCRRTVFFDNVFTYYDNDNDVYSDDVIVREKYYYDDKKSVETSIIFIDKKDNDNKSWLSKLFMNDKDKDLIVQRECKGNKLLQKDCEERVKYGFLNFSNYLKNEE